MTEPRKPRRRRTPTKHALLLKENRHLYDKLLAAQGGRCALCPRLPSPKRKLDLDHDHKTMLIRGLLCHRCNRALPSWMDAAWLLRAAEYVKATESQ